MIENQLPISNRIKKTTKQLLCSLSEWRYKRITSYYNIAGYKRIYLIHIRKTGGTSLNTMFLSLGQDDPQKLYRKLAEKWRLLNNDKVFVAWNTELINRGNYFYAFSHQPFHRLDLPEKTFTISCFRDPVTRVVSHYNMLLQMQIDEPSHPRLASEVGWLGDSFDDFVDRIPKEHLLNQLYMFSEEFDVGQAVERIHKLSHYFFVEDFNQGIDELNLKLNLKLHPVHRRKAVNQVEISNASIARLKKKLAKEYNLFDALEA